MFTFYILNITALLFPKYVSFFLRREISIRPDGFLHSKTLYVGYFN